MQISIMRSAVLVLCLAVAASHAFADPALDSPTNKLLGEAKAASRAEDWANAVTLWAQAALELPDSATAHQQLAYALLNLGRYEEAVQQGRHTVKLAPENADDWSLLCWYQILASHFTEARPSCIKALELDPTIWVAAVNLGHTWLLPDSAEKAKAYYRVALGYLPDQESLESGPLADFDLFIGRGWQTDVAKTTRAWLKAEALPYLEARKLERDAVELHQAGQYSQAITKATAALSAHEQLLGADHPTAAIDLNNIAQILRATGRYAEAEPFFRRALAINEKALPPNHAEVATSFNNLASLLDTLDRYDEAEPLYRNALAIREKALGSEHLEVAISLNRLASLLYTTGRYTEAELLYRRALAIREKALGPNHLDVATSVNNIAELLRATGRHAEAEPLHRRALAIKEEVLDPNDPAVATSLNNLAVLFLTTGIYAEAEPLFRRALAIEEKVLDPNDPSVASSLNNLAELLSATGRYAEAEPLFRRALSINEKAFGPDAPDVATSLNNLAAFLQNIGRYAEAESLFKKSLEIREKVLDPDHPHVAQSLNNLAVLFLTTGIYAKAEPLFRKALAIKEKVLDPNDPAVATSLNNLADLLSITGRYVEAESLHRRALVIRENTLRPNHPDVAQTLSNLAALLQNTGRYAEAEPLYRRALAIREKALGPDHPDVANSLNNLATLLDTTGRYAEAEPMHRRVLAIREEALGPDHPATATSLNNLANLLRATGRNAEAQPLLQQAYQIASPAGEPELLSTVQGSLMGFYKKDNPRLAIFYGKQAINTLQSLRAGLASTERATQQAFTEKVSDTYQSLASLLIDQSRLPEAEQVLAMIKEQEYFDFVRRDATADARETQASYDRAEAPFAGRYSEISGRLVALGRERTELARIQSDFRNAEQKTRLTQLDKDLDIGRAEVLVFSDELQRAFQQLGGERAINFGKKELDALESVQGVLADLHHGAVLIHYLVTPERLRILLTTPDVQLHRDSAITEAELNRLITRYRAVLQNPHQDPLPLAQQLYQVLIEPIQKDLDQAGAKTLMVALDRSLRYLPMAALHNGKHWLAEDYAVALYTAAARSNLDRPPQTDWRVAGLGVSLGGTVEGRDFAPLPAVPLELTGIVRSDANQAGILPGTRRLDGDFTSQSLVDAIRDRYPVLHLATHFHFAPGGTDIDSFLLLGDGQKLTLADFRLGSGYRMEQVDLLTLSACETALGDAQANGSEVEGLGALAQKRGAKAVLATLWSVADASTGLFMRTFYEDRQQQQLTKADAVRQAQLAFINGQATDAGIPVSLRGASRVQAKPTLASYHTDPSKPFAHPYYWAPFVLMGNWL